MKPFPYILPALLSALLPLFSAAAEDVSATERLKSAASDAGAALREAGSVIANEARKAWNSSEAYLSQDPATYKRGAEQKMRELRAEVDQLRQNANPVTTTATTATTTTTTTAATAASTGREYFQTRLTALEQQHDFARQQFAALSDDEIRQGSQGPRSVLDTTLAHLEAHLDIAKQEIDSFRESAR